MKIFIASFGSKDIIQRTLDVHGFQVHGVLTPGDYEEEGFEDGDPMDDKNRMMEEACEKHGCMRPFLVDDSLGNLKALPSTTRGYHVRGTEGLSLDDSKAILQEVVDTGCDAVFLDADLTLFAEHVTSRYYYPLVEKDLPSTDFDVANVVLAEGAVPLLQGLSRM